MNGMLALFSALGLSTAAGLNAYIPLLVIGLLTRYTGLIELQAPYDILANPWVLLGLAIVALLDFVGDKIPAIDHGLHAVGMVISPVAGAIAALAASNAFGGVDPLLAGVAGLIVALGSHSVRTAVRPVSTATTAGLANPVVSFAEDASSLVLSVLAIVLPVLAFLLILLFALLVFWFIRRWRRRKADIVSP